MMRLSAVLGLGLLAVSGVVAQDMAVDASLGTDKEQIRQLQADLAVLGYNVGKPDGSVGGKTKAAALAFAEQYGQSPVIDQALALAVREAALVRTTSPFDQEPVDFPAFLPSDQFSWDINKIKDPACSPKKCVPVAEFLVAGDLTGDAYPELVFATDYQNYDYEHVNIPADIVIFSRDTRGEYKPLPVTTTDGGPLRRVDSRKAVIADFNGDGVGDLFIATTGYDAEPFPGEQNVLLLSSGGGLIDASHTSLPKQNDMAHGVASGDLDKDGDIDLIVITNYGKARIEPYVLWNDGSGSFKQAQLDTILSRDMALFMAKGMKHRSKYVDLSVDDIDADGHVDLLLYVSGDDARKADGYKGMKQTRVVYGDGSGFWSEANAVELPTNRWGNNTYTTDVGIADLDGDGDRDLVATLSFDAADGPLTDWRGQYLQVFLAEGRKFVDATPSSMFGQNIEQTEVRSPHDVHLVDLNGDQSPDIVVGSVDTWTFGETNMLRQSVMIAANDGKARFSRVDPRNWDVGDYTGRSLWPADFDADGDIDLAGFEELGDNTDRGWIIRGMHITVYERLMR